jgi:hypothetical protein
VTYSKTDCNKNLIFKFLIHAETQKAHIFSISSISQELVHQNSWFLRQCVAIYVLYPSHILVKIYYDGQYWPFDQLVYYEKTKTTQSRLRIDVQASHILHPSTFWIIVFSSTKQSQTVFRQNNYEPTCTSTKKQFEYVLNLQNTRDVKIDTSWLKTFWPYIALWASGGW